jgi:maleylpyruvate isomerase
MSEFKLYSFFRSGTSHRLRIALNLKGLTSEYIPINLRTEQHLGEEYRKINPQGFVPSLVTGGTVLTQSPAIIEWLEESYPNPPLLPASMKDRATVRAMAALVGCDTHPINNRRILEYLRKQFGASEDQVNAWCTHWIEEAFDALEVLVKESNSKGTFCFGDTPTLADVYLVPQVESAKRFKVDLKRWPLIQAIDENCSQIAAFANAAPMKQMDAS